MDNLSKFTEKLNSDASLQERMRHLLTTADPLASIVALSEECGAPVTVEELRAADKSEVSESELDQVSGGGSALNMTPFVHARGEGGATPIFPPGFFDSILKKNQP